MACWRPVPGTSFATADHPNPAENREYLDSSCFFKISKDWLGIDLVLGAVDDHLILVSEKLHRREQEACNNGNERRQNPPQLGSDLFPAEFVLGPVTVLRLGVLA